MSPRQENMAAGDAAAVSALSGEPAQNQELDTTGTRRLASERASGAGWLRRRLGQLAASYALWRLGSMEEAFSLAANRAVMASGRVKVLIERSRGACKGAETLRARPDAHALQLQRPRVARLPIAR